MNAPAKLCSYCLIAFASIFAMTSAARPPATLSEGPDFSDLMIGIKKSMKTVSLSIEDPAASARALAAVNEMEVMLLAAKTHEPSNLNEVPRADRKAHATAFRVDLAKTLIETLKLEIAILEGRRDEAMSYVRGSLRDMRDAGHDKYMPGEDG